MNRARTVALVTAALFLVVLPAHAQWLEQVASRISDLGNSLDARGYRLTDDSHNGSLSTGNSTSVTLTLAPGREYVIVGACDDDCGDLDLRLFDAGGTELAEDIAIDATPIVTVPPNQGSDLRVDVVMVQCAAEPCYWGIGVFERGSAMPTPAANHISGELTPGDETLVGGEYFDRHRFYVAAGQRIVVDLRSHQFDPYLILTPPSGEQSSNDDFEGAIDHSRIDVVAHASGEWTALVTSYEEGETGPYQLSVTLGQAAGVGDAFGARFESGRLERGDDTLSSGEYVDRYQFVGEAGERVVIDLRSADFDPYLIVRTPDGERIYNDDYEGDASRSLVSLALPQGGECIVSVTSYKPGESGSYDLQIAGGGDPSAPSPQRVTGVLTAGDETLRDGEFVDQYEFVAAPGQHVTVDLQSDEFDTYLILQAPREGQEENDDTDRAGHSVIEMDVTESGTYRVLVTSYAAGETGSYDLRIDVRDAASSVASRRDVAPLDIGLTANGRLEAGDSEVASGKYRDLYVFEGEVGRAVTVEMNSSAFDTYVGIVTPSGETIENDDYQGSTSRSVVELTLRESGRYRVFATSYAAATGAYQIALRSSAPSASSADPGPATAGRGRVYGVFAGISDYGGRASDLAYTAEDAVRVRDAMIQGGGMRPEDGIVLTDAQATTAGIGNAIRQLASRVRPEDTFVFFYSGHGGRVPSQGQQASDPDGLDETMELFDAGITDDDFSQLIGQVNAGKVILLLDACFSGGFSKDVITVPGRMGMFSSEEDVTSSVAAKFRAGGFLAVFIADAIAEGLADADGDGAVSAIELSQYVHERYRADLKSGGPGDYVRTDGPQLGYQHLVVDRGSIRPYEVLFTPR